MTTLDPIIQAAAGLARQLPAAQMHSFVQAITEEAHPLSPHGRERILGVIPRHAFSLTASQFLDAWTQAEGDVPTELVLAILRTASLTAKQIHDEEQVQLVWTGPKTTSIPLRHTENALLEVIQAARSELLIVSFAVYKAQAIMHALEAALDRGVRLRICVETPEQEGGHMGYDTLAALGVVGKRAQVYIWPSEQRLSPAGKSGSLHAKIAVADDERLFISSANLTDYAMHLNMEMGVVIQGGPLPVRVREHFLELIRTGVLVRAESLSHTRTIIRKQKRQGTSP